MSTFVSAQFPGAIATDASLKIAENGVLTALRGAVTSTDTVWTVGDASRIVANMLLTCGTEIVNVTAVSGNNITVQRGFDGTTAASHTNNSPVFAAVDAWHHNSLAAEVKAIETALGANLSNVGGSTSSSQGALVTNYDFSAQTPGGSLVVGANSITLTPVPSGVNGSDANHYLYISGGTGTAEAALIIGGSAVAGQPSGTVIVTCANTHSGSWTIRSATAGMQEAIQAAGNGNVSVVIPSSVTLNTYAPVYVAGNEVSIIGQGHSSKITPNQTTGNVFDFTGAGLGGSTGIRNSIRNLYMATAAASNLTAVHINGQVQFHAEGLGIANMKKGFHIEGETTTSVVRIKNNNIEGLISTTGIGIHQEGGADIFIDNNVILGASLVSQPQSGIRLDFSTGTKITNNEVFATGFGLYMAPTDGNYVLGVESFNNWYDSGTEDGWAVVPTGTGYVSEIHSVADWFSSFTRNGIEFGSTGTIKGISIVSASIRENGQNGVVYNGGSDVEFVGCKAYANSRTSSGTYNGFQATTGGFRITGGTYAASAGYPTFTNRQGYGIVVSGASVTDYSIVGCTVSPNVTGGLIDSSTQNNRVIRDIIGITNTVSTQAAATTMNFGGVFTGIEVFTITGTTAIQTINGGWIGRSIVLIFSDASPGGVVTGGNIPRTQSAVISQSIRLTYDGQYWY